MQQATDAACFDALVQYVNELIVHDFPALLRLLYRVDVPEATVRKLLQTQPDTDAARLIAQLLVERQVEKMESRQRYRTDEAASDEEKW